MCFGEIFPRFAGVSALVENQVNKRFFVAALFLDIQRFCTLAVIK